MWNAVDLPQPRSPTNATVLPAGILSERPRRIFFSTIVGYANVTLWNSISIPLNGVPSSFANAGLGSASGIGSMSDADSRISKTRSTCTMISRICGSWNMMWFT